MTSVHGQPTMHGALLAYSNGKDITKVKQADEALKVKKKFIERETLIERIEQYEFPDMKRS